MKRLAFIIIAAALPTFAQPANWFATTGAVTLAAAATKATIQQPATGAEQIQLTSAVVRCPAACVITQYQNETTLATATAGTVRGLQPYVASTFTLTFWTASNASGGTTTGVTVCDSACTVPFDLSAISLGSNRASYSIGVSAVTGDVYITFYGTRTQ